MTGKMARERGEREKPREGEYRGHATVTPKQEDKIFSCGYERKADVMERKAFDKGRGGVVYRTKLKKKVKGGVEGGRQEGGDETQMRLKET